MEFLKRLKNDKYDIYDSELPCQNDDVEALKRIFYKHYEEMCEGREHTPLDIRVIENYLGVGKRVQCYGKIFVTEDKSN